MPPSSPRRRAGARPNGQAERDKRRRNGESGYLDQQEFVYTLFPRLKERRRQAAGTLSGGERQMLAVGRALMANPSLILLDEPTEGLAPVIVDQLGQIFNTVARQGTALLLIEQNMSLVVRVAERYCAMAKGSVVAQGPVENSPAGLRDLEAHVMV